MTELRHPRLGHAARRQCRREPKQCGADQIEDSQNYFGIQQAVDNQSQCQWSNDGGQRCDGIRRSVKRESQLTGFLHAGFGKESVHRDVPCSPNEELQKHHDRETDDQECGGLSRHVDLEGGGGISVAIVGES